MHTKWKCTNLKLGVYVELRYWGVAVLKVHGFWWEQPMKCLELGIYRPFQFLELGYVFDSSYSEIIIQIADRC